MDDAGLAGLEVGYDIPARPGMPEAEVQTPCLLLDLDVFEANLAMMRDLCSAAGVALRAHGKMHKSADVARAQIARGGAVGICCQKVSEAEAFVRAGITDVLVSNQVRDTAKIDRLARLARRARLAVCVDAVENVADLSAAAQRHAVELGVLVEIDCGAGRCGVAPGAAAVALAQAVAGAPGLRFQGLQAYQGAAQHVADHAARQALISVAVAGVRDTLTGLVAAGLPCPIVTGAGTGSFAFEAGSGHYTEVQCGSYAFMDADYATVRDAAGRPPPFGQALFVLAGIMSTPGPGRAVCDAGLKVLAVDSGLPLVAGRPGVTYLGASDEHGTVADPGGSLRAGDRLRLIPGHCDPTVNLHDWIVGVRGGRVEVLWPVTARGKVW